MALRPIDMLGVVQNGPELGRNHASEGVRPEVSFHQFAEKLQKEVEHNDRQVIQTSKSEGGLVDKDGRNNTGGGSSRQKRRKPERDEEKQKPQSVSMFDVSI